MISISGTSIWFIEMCSLKMPHPEDVSSRSWHTRIPPNAEHPDDALRSKFAILRVNELGPSGTAIPLGQCQLELLQIATGPVRHDIKLRDDARLIFGIKMTQAPALLRRQPRSHERRNKCLLCFAVSFLTTVYSRKSASVSGPLDVRR